MRRDRAGEVSGRLIDHLHRTARAAVAALVASSTIGANLAQAQPAPSLPAAFPSHPSLSASKFPRDAMGWSTLDWETGLRVKRMSRDEIAGLTDAAQKGDLYSQTLLGIAYREGIERSTIQGSGRALTSQATVRGGASNTEALRWLRRAAEAGYPMAQVELGEMYYAGHGVERNLEEATSWMRKAAAHDYPRAKMNLLQMTLVGEGRFTPENLREITPRVGEILRPFKPQ